MNRMRVLSFNIRGSYVKSDGDNLWEKRAALNVETIHKLAPGLIGFQELQLGNLALYEKELAEYDFVLGPKYNNRPPYCYPSIFWHSEQFQRLEHGEFWLSETPTRHSASWDTNCIRGALWVRFRCLPAGHEFVMLNTHLDHVSERARVHGARVILEHLRRIAPKSAPVLVTGDFNCNPGSDAYNLFVEKGFADTFAAAGLLDAPGVFTFHAFTGRGNGKDTRIDWIMTRDSASKFSTKSFEIVLDAKPPLFPSDHFPVVANLELGS
ncbi:MAG: endonuclease/exonuclease/phosphatase family protein [Planctomycetota bacterium]|nr:endonuclease/exonuclease/phosphatase family protein [Planctomycetota bacterium]